MSAVEDQLAEALAEELSGLLGEQWGGEVTVVAPSGGMVAGSAFQVAISRPPDRPLALELPCGLAIGYLGDEENAVDAWKSWTEELAKRLRGPATPPPPEPKP